MGDPLLLSSFGKDTTEIRADEADEEWSMPTTGEDLIYACGVFGIISLMKSKNLDVTLIDLSKEDYKEAYESVISKTPNGRPDYFPEAWCAHMNTLLTKI